MTKSNHSDKKLSIPEITTVLFITVSSRKLLMKIYDASDCLILDIPDKTSCAVSCPRTKS
jgi:hypothetical protein